MSNTNYDLNYLLSTYQILITCYFKAAQHIKNTTENIKFLKSKIESYDRKHHKYIVI